MRQAIIEVLLKVPLKRKIFSRFSIVQNIWNTTAKNILAKKIFVVVLFALQNVAFSTFERRMLLTVKRSRERSLWRKKLCWFSAVKEKMADSKKKTVFVESVRGRNRWKNKLHEWYLNTRHIVSYFPKKSCHKPEMAEIFAETVVWTSRLRLHVQCCVLDILRTQLFNWPPFLEVHTVGAKLKKKF